VHEEANVKLCCCGVGVVQNNNIYMTLVASAVRARARRSIRTSGAEHRTLCRPRACGTFRLGANVASRALVGPSSVLSTEHPSVRALVDVYRRSQRRAGSRAL